jgi:hypothetical protein
MDIIRHFKDELYHMSLRSVRFKSPISGTMEVCLKLGSNGVCTEVV